MELVPSRATSDAPVDSEPAVSTSGRHAAGVAILVFVGLFAVYLSNGDFLPCSDATATTYLPLHLIGGELPFTPANAPFMFDVDPEGGPALKRGSYIVPTTRGTWANTFGFGTAVVAVPAFVVARLVFGPEIAGRHDVIWFTAKVAASAMVAGSGAFVFLAALRFTTWRRAVLIALAYGLGTCVWTLSSQALWQHPANELFVALGAWCFVRGWRLPGDVAAPHWGWAAGAGLAWSWAVACRPTSLLLLAAAGVGLAIVHRRSAVALLVGAVPVGLVLAVHNALLFGSPVRFGQTVHTATASEYLARKGVESPWTWAVWDGAAGLLLSPSRGLLVYSPFLVFALVGMVRASRDPRWSPLRPLVVGTLLTWLVAFAWFDWWGGWSYGYRPIVDTAPLLALLLVPVLPTVLGAPARRIAFALLLAWAVGVQALGAFAYNARGWNHRLVFEMVMADGSTVVTADLDEVDRLTAAGGLSRRAAVLNVDLPENRHRLWSVTDSQILFYLGNLERSRETKKRDQAAWLRQFVDAP